MHVKKRKQHGWLLSVIIGSGFALVVSGILIGLLTGLILSERIGEGIGERIVYGVQMIAVFIGAELAKRIYGVSNIRIPAAVTGIYVAATIVGGMLQEGKFQNMLSHILAICVGCLISCALCIRKTGRSGKRKKGVW